MDLSKYIHEERGAYILARLKDEVDTLSSGHKKDVIPTNVIDKAAYKKWLELVSEDSDCYHDKMIVRGSDEVLNMKTSKAAFYRSVNSLVGPSNEDKSKSKKFWHKFISASLREAKLRKKAFKQTEVSKEVKTSNKLESRFSHFRPYHQYIVEMYGKMFNTKEIREILLEKGVDISVKSLQDFYAFHEDIITKTISSFKESFDDIRLGYKRSRLEEYAWIYHNLKKDFKNPKTPIHKKTAFSKEMQSCLKAIKDEVEGNLIKIDANVNVNQQINIHLTQQILDRKTVALVSIAKAAQNLNVEPAGLIYEMEKSYYKKYNAFIGGDPLDDSLELPDQNYKPSDYDYDRLDDLSKQQQKLLNEKEDAIKAKRMEMRNIIRNGEIRKKLKESLELSRKALSESEPSQDN